jgi:hypothetical protein
MALTTQPLPFGLRQVMVAPLTAGTDLIGTKVALPLGQTLTFTEGTDSVVLRGDDRVAATRDTGAQVTWELEEGGISFEAYKVIAGGTITETGTTPAQKKVYKKTGSDVRPNFYLEGRALSESGGDFHVRFPKAKADGDIKGELSDQNFWVTSLAGSAIASLAAADNDTIYEFVQNETAVVIT